MYYNQNVVVQMNIGIDIDNVISNFNEVLLNEFFIHDKDLSYTFKRNDRKIKFVTFLDSDKIYNDLFNKLGEKGQKWKIY